MKLNKTANRLQAIPLLLLKGRALVLAVLSASIFAACASTSPGGGTVVSRAESRWDAIIAGDFDTAYQYYTPGYRSSNTLGDFEISMRLRKVQIREAQFLEQDCEESVCTLKFKTKFRVASPVPGLDAWTSTTKIEEKWVKTQGKWWYFPEDN
jgi:hypothetical protein